MSQTDFAANLIGFIDADLSLDPTARIDLDTELVDNGIIDSLGILRIVAYMQDEMAVELEPDELTVENFASVAAMIALVERVSR